MEADIVQHVYQTLHDVALMSNDMGQRSVGLHNAGYLAIDSLRIEAGRLAWGHELTPEETPLEAGLGFAVKLGKPGSFIGEAALTAQKVKGLSKRCCLFE